MSTIARRWIVLLAALMLAGATVGCEREAEQEGIVEEEQEGVALGDEGMEGGLGDEVEPEAAREELAEGMTGEEDLEETRDDVADELGIPTNALVFGPDVRQSILNANNDFEREAWGTVGAIEQQLTRINMQDLDETEQQAAQELQQQITSAQQNLQEMERASEQEAEQMESQMEEELGEIRKNWNEIVDKMKFEEQPAGGGPLEDQEGMMEGEEGGM
ncbi:hypothetical protein FIV42_16680 [Persicimonas caeni]|uniref:Uncharacterized protein n=1 Tax=Persicimonas caeni TaxID=2292766 RepID=A0A4Y6PVP6_PERCE|nr:hypothetical protein [Persicimonas caeni]QDG52313.1 hypothetical protein FIV42_16680 [Persicimonas caeni]QED33535.1 hypothetical protein FRD00_16675 [Persicimonas caeni]